MRTSDPAQRFRPKHLVGPLRVYVSAPSAERERARDLMSALRSIGAEVVSTWVECIDKQAALGRKHDDDVPLEELREILRDDLWEVETAHAHVHICGKSDGSHTELGHSLRRGDEMGAPIVIAVGKPRGFELLADVFAEDEAHAVRIVKGLVVARG